MIKRILVFLFIIFTLDVEAQINLVPNPSFELYDTCPSATSPISFATGWESYTDSPDYFNSCSSIGTGYNVPSTGFGYQMAYDGNAYGGIALYGVNTTPVREYFGIQLLSPLVIGQKYFISFEASLADALGLMAGAINWEQNLLRSLFRLPMETQH